jgi:hypothetical protein
LVLISSLGKLSNPPEDVDVETDVLTTLFGAAVPSKGFFSYSVSSALSSAGLTSLRNPLMSENRKT